MLYISQQCCCCGRIYIVTKHVGFLQDDKVPDMAFDFRVSSISVSDRSYFVFTSEEIQSMQAIAYFDTCGRFD